MPKEKTHSFFITDDEHLDIQIWLLEHREKLLEFNNYTKSHQYYLNSSDRPRPMSVTRFRDYMIGCNLQIVARGGVQKRYANYVAQIEALERRIVKLEAALGNSVSYTPKKQQSRMKTQIH